MCKTSELGRLDAVLPFVEARIGRSAVRKRCHRRSVEEDYELKGEVLGQGGTASVLLATSRLPGGAGRRYAVKRLETAGRSKAELSEIEAELSVALTVDHPNVVRATGLYEDLGTGRLDLVMESLEGGELFRRLAEEGRFSEQRAAEVSRQMLLAVGYLHGRGVAHRDLKLENFMYESSDSEQLKLIDFGFSIFGHESMDDRVGTEEYMAPELIQGCYSKQCDVWSLGIITFVLLSGFMPFRGTGEVLWENIASANFSMSTSGWRSISLSARGFVQSLLEVDPSKRFTADAALAHPWIARRAGRLQQGIEQSTIAALRAHSSMPHLERCCLSAIAWSLASTEQAVIREQFLALSGGSGVIGFQDLRDAMGSAWLGASNAEVSEVISALTSARASSSDGCSAEVTYANFSAAMVLTHVALSDDLLLAAFRWFDVESSGDITAEELREPEGNEAVHDIRAWPPPFEAEHASAQALSYSEFSCCVRSQLVQASLLKLEHVQVGPMFLGYWRRRMRSFLGSPAGNTLMDTIAMLMGKTDTIAMMMGKSEAVDSLEALFDWCAS